MLGRVAVLVLVVTVLAVGQQPSKQPFPSGRYQLLSAKVLENVEAGGVAPFDELFLVDTETGTTWKYAHFEMHQKLMIPAHFESVPVDGLNWDIMKMLDRQTNEKETK